jgi:hypothetical protein
VGDVTKLALGAALEEVDPGQQVPNGVSTSGRYLSDPPVVEMTSDGEATAP